MLERVLNIRGERVEYLSEYRDKAKQIIKALSWALILIGLFFITDYLFLHVIQIDWARIDFKFLPSFTHAIMGVIFVIIAWQGLEMT